MTRSFLALPLVVALAFFSSAASAKGCLKGAAVDGVAGHVAGEHGVFGAAARCAVGRQRANKKEKEKEEQAAKTSQNQMRSASQPETPSPNK